MSTHASRPWLRWVSLLVVAMAMLATVPDPGRALDHGVDPSYQWALNRGAADGLVHGRDIVFNYGPFGYLLFPLDIGTNLRTAMAVQWLFWALLAALLVATWRQAPPSAVLAFAAALTVSQGLHLHTEYLWLLTLALLLAHCPPAGRLAPFAGAGAGAIAAFLVFVKFSTGTAAALMAGAVAVVLAQARTKASLRTLATLAAGCMTVLVTVVAAHFASLHTFARWLQLSVEISNGYSSAMSLQGSTLELLLAVAVVACVVSVTLCWLYSRAASLAVAAVFTLPVLLAYKHALVRQATHGTLFFPVGLVFLAALVPLASDSRSRRCAAAFFATVLVLVAVETGLRRSATVSSLLASAGPLAGLRRAVAVADLPGIRRNLAERSRDNLAGERLPDDWLALLRHDSGGVDVVPYELSLVPANGLAWRPNPVFQTYNAYTPLLDLASAEHFEGPDAPAFVILHLATIDLRHPLADAPRTARALLRRYRPVGHDDVAQRVLLQLAEEVVLGSTAAGLPAPVEQEAVLGEWVTVPPSSVLLAAEFHFRPTLQERMQKLLFRVPAMSMELQYEDGRVLAVRILPETAGGGIPISHLPRSAASADALFAGNPAERVVRFRIGGLGALLYEPEFTIGWTPAVSSAARPR